MSRTAAPRVTRLIADRGDAPDRHTWHERVGARGEQRVAGPDPATLHQLVGQTPLTVARREADRALAGQPRTGGEARVGEQQHRGGVGTCPHGPADEAVAVDDRLPLAHAVPTARVDGDRGAEAEGGTRSGHLCGNCRVAPGPGEPEQPVELGFEQIARLVKRRARDAAMLDAREFHQQPRRGIGFGVGERGVDQLLAFMRDGMERTMALTGVRSVAEIDRSLLRRRVR